jgi:hypothetical protein
MKVENLFQLKPHEEIMEVIRESIYFHLLKFVLIIFWLLLPFLFLFPLFREGTWGIILFFIVFLSGLIALIRKSYCWTRTVLVVTDKRVIDLEQKGFFDKVVTEATYKQIDEVTYRIKGFIPTIFRYGKVSLHLGGSAADIEFSAIQQPSRVHDLINDLRDEYEKRS